MLSKLTKRHRTAALLLAAVLGPLLMVACSSMPSQQSTGQAIDDGVITASIKARLIEDPLTKAHQINVDTFKGSVQLSGFVENEQARTRALQLARDVDGVKQVKDALQIRNATS